MMKMKNKKQLMLGLFYYTSGSIFGPLVLFGGIGYFVDKMLGTKPLYLLIGVGVAFIFTNILVIKKSKSIGENISKMVKKGNEEKDNSENLPAGQAGKNNNEV